MNKWTNYIPRVSVLYYVKGKGLFILTPHKDIEGGYARTLLGQ